MQQRFTLDRRHGRLLGVCAGVARAIDVHPDLVRILAILLTIVAGPIAPAAYLIAAFTAARR